MDGGEDVGGRWWDWPKLQFCSGDGGRAEGITRGITGSVTGGNRPVFTRATRIKGKAHDLCSPPSQSDGCPVDPRAIIHTLEFSRASQPRWSVLALLFPDLVTLSKYQTSWGLNTHKHTRVCHKMRHVTSLGQLQTHSEFNPRQILPGLEVSASLERLMSMRDVPLRAHLGWRSAGVHEIWNSRKKGLGTHRASLRSGVSSPQIHQQLTRTQEAKDAHSVASGDHDEVAESSQVGAVQGQAPCAPPGLPAVVEEHQHRRVGGLWGLEKRGC